MGLKIRHRKHLAPKSYSWKTDMVIWLHTRQDVEMEIWRIYVTATMFSKMHIVSHLLIIIIVYI